MLLLFYSHIEQQIKLLQRCLSCYKASTPQLLDLNLFLVNFVNEITKDLREAVHDVSVKMSLRSPEALAISSKCRSDFIPARYFSLPTTLTFLVSSSCCLIIFGVVNQRTRRDPL